MINFADELEVFRTEEESAQQAFFAYLSVRSLAATDQDVLANMNNTPLFRAASRRAFPSRSRDRARPAPERRARSRDAVALLCGNQ